MIYLITETLTISAATTSRPFAYALSLEGAQRTVQRRETEGAGMHGFSYTIDEVLYVSTLEGVAP